MVLGGIHHHQPQNGADQAEIVDANKPDRPEAARRNRRGDQQPQQNAAIGQREESLMGISTDNRRLQSKPWQRRLNRLPSAS